MNKKALGVFCKKDKSFYYIEAGENHVNNTVSRLVKVLQSRGLIELDHDNPYTHTQYEAIPCGKALEQDMEMKPVYLSKHIKQTLESQTKEQKSGKWK